MAIFLNILRIIGIILLVILAILLVLLLLVLFCPVVYRIKGEKKEKLLLHMRISWLFPLVYGNIVYEEKLSCILYFLGIPVYDVLAEKKDEGRKKEKKKKTKATKKEKAKEPSTSSIDATDELKNQPQTNKVDVDSKHQEKNEIKKVETEKKETDIEETDIEETDIEETDIEEAEIVETNTKEQEEEENVFIFKRISMKVKEFFGKLKLFFKKLFEKVKNIKYTILNMKKKMENIKETITWYQEVFSREESKRAIEKGKNQLVKLFKHIKPKKIRGTVLFGCSDPASTGEVLGILSMFYPIIGNHINIVPDFQQEIFEGDFFIKGRIRVFHLLRVGWSILFDKDIRKLYNILTGGKKHE